MNDTVFYIDVLFLEGLCNIALLLCVLTLLAVNRHLRADLFRRERWHERELAKLRNLL